MVAFLDYLLINYLVKGIICNIIIIGDHLCSVYKLQKYQPTTMSSAIDSDNYLESSRLKNLLPVGWSNEISILAVPARKNWWDKLSLITTSKKTNNAFLIVIDFRRWQYFDEDARNLLWWHELALIQQHSIKSDRQTVITGATGLMLAASQILSQDMVMLSIGFTIAGLAGFQLYQNRRGERYIRQITQADQGAISIAKQFGYSTALAAATLQSALKILAAKATGQTAKVYHTRLQVLDICNNLNIVIFENRIDRTHDDANNMTVVGAGLSKIPNTVKNLSIKTRPPHQSTTAS
jgi:Protein of unknown function (DUF3318)